jgi:4'-phosphopantetheinyl transferase
MVMANAPSRLMSFNGTLSGTPASGGTDRAGAPFLAPGEIHVWTVAIDERKEGTVGSMETLAPAERIRASRFRFAVDAARFIQRRRALRDIVGSYLGIAPADVVFATNQFGKPSVGPSTTCTELSFNASHSGAIALVAVSRSVRIGVDVERLRPDVECLAVATRFFGAGEVASLAALDPADRVAGFFNAWTRKEAVVKALGGGLSIPLDAFEVSLRPGEPPAIVRWDIPGDGGQQWRIHHLAPANGYVGALAADAASCRCRFFDWTD